MLSCYLCMSAVDGVRSEVPVQLTLFWVHVTGYAASGAGFHSRQRHHRQKSQCLVEHPNSGRKLLAVVYFALNATGCKWILD